MAAVELQDVGKTYRGAQGEAVQAVRHLNLAVPNRALTVLVGPSGCGKTSVLRMIAGLESVTTGRIFMDGRRVDGLPCQDRGVSMVFQNYALFPHLTVFENLAFGLNLKRLPKAEINQRVGSVVETLGLSGLLERKPAGLSGGERQRVALGRAMVRQPKVFLLDEPLSNLDAPMRVQLRVELSRLQRRLDATMLHVTHDQVEAMTLGDRIAVMNEGVVQQVADPVTLYEKPANLFVAGFIGSPPMNLFRGVLMASGGRLHFCAWAADASPGPFRVGIPPPVADGLPLAEGSPVVLGVRPEQIRVCLPEDPAAGPNCFPATVEAVEMLGAEMHVHLRTGSHRFIARTPRQSGRVRHEELRVGLEMGQARFFDPVSGQILN